MFIGGSMSQVEGKGLKGIEGVSWPQREGV